MGSPKNSRVDLGSLFPHASRVMRAVRRDAAHYLPQSFNSAEFGLIVACGALASAVSKLGLPATWLIATDTKISAYCERYIALLFGTITGPVGLFRDSEDTKTV
jgi:hypothetical protein